MVRKKLSGSFGMTLSEVLVVVAIMALVATFTIPKVLKGGTMSASDYSARAKQAAVMIQSAYSQYRMESEPTANFNAGLLLPYMNYAKTDNSTTIDSEQGSGTLTCNGGTRHCLVLLNGGRLLYYPGVKFDGTDTTNAVTFFFDPDGEASDNKSVQFILYYDGALKTRGTSRDNTVTSADNFVSPCASCDPPWFTWD